MKNRYISFTTPASTLSVALPLTGLLALMLVPGTMSVTTFAALATAMLGTVFVAMNSWNNGQATRSVAHVLNDTETRARDVRG